MYTRYKELHSFFILFFVSAFVTGVFRVVEKRKGVGSGGWRKLKSRAWPIVTLESAATAAVVVAGAA